MSDRAFSCLSTFFLYCSAGYFTNLLVCIYQSALRFKQIVPFFYLSDYPIFSCSLTFSLGIDSHKNAMLTILSSDEV